MNLYILPDEVREDLPDMMQEGTTAYDRSLYRRCQNVSRWIDRRCKRAFYPQLATRYFSVGEPRGAESALGILWVPDLISVTSIGLSFDDGLTYTELAETDYLLAVSEDFDKPCSYNTIILTVNGAYSSFPRGQRSVRITGVWGYTEDRATCWEASGVTLVGDVAAGATELTVSDGGAADLFGAGTALLKGRLIRMDDEYFFVTQVVDDVVSVVGGQNGTNQADHLDGAAIDLWRPHPSVVDAARELVIKEFLDSQQGYAMRGAENVGGQVRYGEYVDGRILAKLSSLIRTAL